MALMAMTVYPRGDGGRRRRVSTRPPADSLAYALREARTEAGLSQAMVERAIQMSQPLLSRLERGVRPPTPEELASLAQLYQSHRLLSMGQRESEMEPPLRRASESGISQSSSDQSYDQRWGQLHSRLPVLVKELAECLLELIELVTQKR